MATSSHSVTRLLLCWRQEDAAALEQLIPLAYQKLRRLARHYTAGQRPDHTLQATALVVFISNFVDHLRQRVGVK